MTAPKAPAPPAVRVDAPTEERNPRSLDIDRLDTVGILRLINDEDTQVPRAVAEVLDAVAAAVDFAVAALRAGPGPPRSRSPTTRARRSPRSPTTC